MSNKKTNKAVKWVFALGVTVYLMLWGYTAFFEGNSIPQGNPKKDAPPAHQFLDNEDLPSIDTDFDFYGSEVAYIATTSDGWSWYYYPDPVDVGNEERLLL